MRTVAFAAVAALALSGCGGSGSGGKAPDGAVPPAPGEEAGVPGSRGGGTPQPGGDGAAPDGRLDGGSTPDARPGDRAPDLARDLAADLPAATPDVAPPPSDGPSDICAAGGTCSMLEGQYVAALRRARTCNPTLKGQCALSRPSSLACSGCNVWVTSAVELDALRMSYTDAGCAQCKRICPLIACALPTVGVCRLNRGPVVAAPDRIVPPIGATGMCYDMNDPVPVGPAQ